MKLTVGDTVKFKSIDGSKTPYTQVGKISSFQRMHNLEFIVVVNLENQEYYCQFVDHDQIIHLYSDCDDIMDELLSI